MALAIRRLLMALSLVFLSSGKPCGTCSPSKVAYLFFLDSEGQFRVLDLLFPSFGQLVALPGSAALAQGSQY